MYFFCGSDQTWRLELYNKDVDASQIMMNFRAQELIFSHMSDIFVRDFFRPPMLWRVVQLVQIQGVVFF